MKIAITSTSIERRGTAWSMNKEEANSSKKKTIDGKCVCVQSVTDQA